MESSLLVILLLLSLNHGESRKWHRQQQWRFYKTHSMQQIALAVVGFYFEYCLCSPKIT